ncbi:serine/arginine repetitive matrix protein 1-like isoform X2 [Hetaerina americana]|uniref:serine/arginine repetitive matrix protein 1-like isoform X2 n=1 Tax=Hetaerina americana TaxID=62018 RepID=UPI003A7F5276
MPSRSPSRCYSPRSRASNRSPSFGMHGSSRRGRTPPTDGGRHRILSRGGRARSSDGSVGRGRGSEKRHPPRSIPSGGFPQSQYSGIQHSPKRIVPRTGKQAYYSPPLSEKPSTSGLKRKYSPHPQHSPKRIAPRTGKQAYYSPSLSAKPSTSGLKRKYSPHPPSPSSSSSSASSCLVPVANWYDMRLRNKMDRPCTSKRLSPQELGRKYFREKSPVRDKVHRSQSSPHYKVRDNDRNFERSSSSDGSLYSVGRPSGQTVSVNRNFISSPRRHENTTKRYISDSVVRYSGGNSDAGAGRPLYRGPDKTESARFNERKLKKIQVGIFLKRPRDSPKVNEPHINRQIVKPEDITVVRRPGEGSRPIFAREELQVVVKPAGDVDDNYVERERRSRQDYHSGGEEHHRAVVRHRQAAGEQVVKLVCNDDPTMLAASSSHRSLQAQSHRSRSPRPSTSRAGDARLESISPVPFPSVERRERRGDSRPSYYNMSPSPPPRIASSFVSGRSRDYEQAGPSRPIPSTSSQSHHKEGRRGDDLRIELEYRRRDDGTYKRGNQESRTDSDGQSSDLRMRIKEKRTSNHRALSHYHVGEDVPIIHSKVSSERAYAVSHRLGDGPPEQRHREPNEHGGGHHSVIPPEQEMITEDFQSRSSFHNKSSSSSIPSWDGNPEYVPKGRAYYEHDNRDEEWLRLGRGGGPRVGRSGRFSGSIGRGRGRMFRRGYNARGRGRGRGRGFFAGGTGPNQGYIRGGRIRRAVDTGAPEMGGSSNNSRGKATSPSLWKHDMFENLSSDENRPTSTSDKKK